MADQQLDDRSFYWDWAKHEENLLTNRGSFFLVGQSMLFAGVATLRSVSEASARPALPVFYGLGIFIALIWLGVGLLFGSFFLYPLARDDAGQTDWEYFIQLETLLVMEQFGRGLVSFPPAPFLQRETIGLRVSRRNANGLQLITADIGEGQAVYRDAVLLEHTRHNIADQLSGCT